MERQHQDLNFDVCQARNRDVSQLIGAVDLSRPDDQPTLVFALFTEPNKWHRFFLDIGCAFWDLQSEEEHTEEIDDLLGDDMRLVDYRQLLGEFPMTLEYANSTEETNGHGARITLQFESGASMTLVPFPPRDERGYHVVFTRSANSE